ncbi:MAG: hypothetical protein R3C18_06630 [Planctomycetaceae bacterium]
MNGRPVRVGFATAVVLLLATVHGGAAPPELEGDDPSLVQVVETHWGFDGTILAQNFMPVAFRVQNTTSIPWEGDFVLSRTAAAKPVGCQLKRHVTLGPDEDRWVQFTPFIVDNLDNWQLSWGAGEFGSMDVNSPATGPAATVLIYDNDAVSPPGGILRRMPEELFPQSITEMTALRGIILSHVPFWTGARQRTLLEWLNQGGRVYLLLDDDGKYPAFPESLKVLNTEQDEFSVGAGNVKRVPVKVADITLEEARQELFLDDQPTTFRNRGKMATSTFVGSYKTVGFARSTHAFRELRKMSAFHRPWLLIYAAVFAYLFIQFPVCYRMGVTHTKVRRFYLLFFGSAILFSILFAMLGRVGARERSRIRSIGVAQQVDTDTFDVSRWTLATVKDEGEYELESPGSGNCISVSDSGLDSTEALAESDLDRQVTGFEMAPTSSIPFIERHRISSPIEAPRILDFELATGRVLSIRVDPGKDFSSDVISAWVVRGATMFPLDVEKPIWELDRKRQIETIAAYIGPETTQQFNYLWWWFGIGFSQSESEKREQEETVLKRLEPLLVADAFGIRTESNSPFAQSAPGTVRILVYRHTPVDFRHGESQFADQRGALLFSFTAEDPVLATDEGQ